MVLFEVVEQFAKNMGTWQLQLCWPDVYIGHKQSILTQSQHIHNTRYLSEGKITEPSHNEEKIL